MYFTILSLYSDLLIEIKLKKDTLGFFFTCELMMDQYYLTNRKCKIQIMTGSSTVQALSLGH